jgi:phenylalanyl-tRNA synthetase beta chain
LFEVGQIFMGTTPTDQRTAATVLRRGTSGVRGGGRHWLGHASKVSVFDAKADALAIIQAAGFPAERVEVSQGGPAWAHPGQSGTLRIGREVIGAFGLLHPLVAEELALDAETVAAEVILEALPLSKAKASKTKPALVLSAFQPVHRDFAFLAPKALKASEVIKALMAADKKLVTQVEIFDVYAGQGVPDGFVSLALRATLQPTNATLSEADIDAVSKAIVAAAKSVGAELRQ